MDGQTDEWSFDFFCPFIMAKWDQKFRLGFEFRTNLVLLFFVTFLCNV